MDDWLAIGELKDLNWTDVSLQQFLLSILLHADANLIKVLPLLPGVPTLQNSTLEFLQENFSDALPPHMFPDEWSILRDMYKSELKNKTDLTPNTRYKLLRALLLADRRLSLDDGVTPDYEYITTIKEMCGVLCDPSKGTFEDGLVFRQRKIEKMMCNQYFDPLVFIERGHEQPEPPRKLVEKYRKDFMFGFMPHERISYKDFNNSKGRGHLEHWSIEMINMFTEELKRKKMRGNYGIGESNALMEALQTKIKVNGKRVLVIGSENPWLETIILAAGANKIVTLEYSKVFSEHPLIETMLPVEFRQKFYSGTLEKFDVVVTFHSLEHSGLGRYGDALNPWGDIIELARAWCVTKPGGQLLLGHPSLIRENKGILQFNEQRVYGKERYTHFTTGWKQIYRGQNYYTLLGFQREDIPMEY
eukprot:g3859.t1